MEGLYSGQLFARSDIDGVYVFVSLIVAAALVFLDFLIAKYFRNIACDKGYPGKAYFHFCFWLGLPGWIMVAALPDRKDTAAISDSPDADPPKKRITKEEGKAERTKAEGVSVCEMCSNEGQELYQGVMMDEYGTRYRKVCRSCWQKYNFTKY